MLFFLCYNCATLCIFIPPEKVTPERVWSAMLKGNSAVCKGSEVFNWNHVDEVVEQNLIGQY